MTEQEKVEWYNKVLGLALATIKRESLDNFKLHAGNLIKLNDEIINFKCYEAEGNRIKAQWGYSFTKGNYGIIL